MLQTADNGFDAAVVDRENHAVALIEVKAHPVEKWATILPKQTGQIAEQTAFVLTVDPICIQLYRPAGQNLGEPIAHLDTRQILQYYDPEFSRKRVFQPYLLTLVEAWLRDLAYHWKSENPPGSEELASAGLLEKLEGGGQRSVLELDVDVIVYVETNFLMSVAMGREARGHDLLAAVSSSVRVVIPSGCYMESFSAFEDEQKRRNWFRGELDKQIVQLRRDTTSANAGALLSQLEESIIANDQLLNDVQARLFQFVDLAAGTLERIPETYAIIHSAVTATLIPDPTDNLILHSILDHACHFPDATKALLTDNTRDFDTQGVQAALAAVGISRPFRSVTNVLGWLQSRPG